MKNKSNGNMYEWINKTANPLGGECSHKCSYCYVEKLKHSKPVIRNKYSGDPFLSENGMKKICGKYKFIFVCDMTDLFAKNVPFDFIKKIIDRCNDYPENKYLFQTKNPSRINGSIMPKNSVICTTIESNRYYKDIMKNSPPPYKRALGMYCVDLPKYVTIEPILDFDLYEMVEIIRICNAIQCNIGADSGNNNLPEPSKEKILKLINELEKLTIVKQKKNLNRLLK